MKLKLTNEDYDFFKKIALYFLPALATLVITICKIWNLPFGAEIGATITAIDTFLGAILGISSANYNKSTETIKIKK